MMSKTYPFKIDDLPYSYDALELVIDTETMTIHHDKHHQSYCDNLNKLLEENPQLKTSTLEELLSSDVQGVRNNAGGVWNHDFFWKIMTRPGSGHVGEDFLKKIKESFGTMDEFMALFEKTALGRFGSGWAWLVMNRSGGLEVMSTPNQDNPLVDGLKPVLAIDVWEHAYYLKYKNKRVDYVKAWWEVVSWDAVGELAK